MKIYIIALLLSLVYINQVNSLCDCGPDHVLSENTNTCIDIPKKQGDTGYIANCEEYETGFASQSGLDCAKCASGFVYDSFDETCADSGIEGCDIADKFLNDFDCLSCVQGKYWDETNCVQNPQSGSADFVDGCTLYGLGVNNAVECKECGDGKYADLQEKVCKNNPVSGENGYSENCVLYAYSAGLVQCFRCDDDFIYKSNTECVGIQQANCLVADGLDCLVCEDGYVFDHGQHICIQNPQQGDSNFIQDCEVYKQRSSDIECEFCKKGYYLENSICTMVSDPDANCLYVNSLQGCEVCQQGYFPNMGCKVCPTKPNAGGPKNSGVEVLRLSFIAILVVIMVTII